jgi:hypothetical protein
MVNGRQVRFPLEFYRVSAVDMALVRPVFPLWVRTRGRKFVDLVVRVDSGSSLTTISVARATALDLYFPPKAVALTLETASGQVQQLRHPSRITARIPGLDGRDFDWPCHFVEHAGDAPPMAVLGLTGVLDDLRISLDGSYAVEAPYGWLILEKMPRSDPI